MKRWESAIGQLQAHLIATLRCKESFGRRLLRSQLARQVHSHPYYDKKRRRAAVIMIQAKCARRTKNKREYLRLLDERNALLQVVHSRCSAMLLQTGRCPRGGGTGPRIRLNTECSSCQVSGRITPDIALASRKFGADVRRKVEKVIDE